MNDSISKDGGQFSPSFDDNTEYNAKKKDRTLCRLTYEMSTGLCHQDLVLVYCESFFDSSDPVKECSVP